MNNSKQTEKNTIKTSTIDIYIVHAKYQHHIGLFKKKRVYKKVYTIQHKDLQYLMAGSCRCQWRFGRWSSISFTCEVSGLFTLQHVYNFSQHQNLLGQWKQIGPPLISQVIFSFLQDHPCKTQPLFFGGHRTASPRKNTMQFWAFARDPR